jgi:hypothetical protein
MTQGIAFGNLIWEATRKEKKQFIVKISRKNTSQPKVGSNEWRSGK